MIFLCAAVTQSPYMYVYTKAKQFPYVTDKIAHRYAVVVLRESKKYNLNPYLVSDIIQVESEFDWKAQSAFPAFGPMQVTEAWFHVLYRINDALKYELKYLERKGKKIDHARYLKQVGFGVACGCYILRSLIDRHGDLKLALIAYNYGDGPKNDVFNQAKVSRSYRDKLEYIKRIKRLGNL